MAGYLLQPAAAVGVDSYMSNNNPNTNYGAATTMWSMGATSMVGDIRRFLVNWDLSSIAVPAADVGFAKMLLTRSAAISMCTVALTLGAHRIVNAWDEAQVTWNDRLTGVPWTAVGGGGDYNPVAEANLPFDPLSHLVTAITWWDWDITAQVQRWMLGTNPNYGLISVVAPDDSWDNDWEYRTSDYATAARRPLLWAEDNRSPVRLVPVAAGALNEWTDADRTAGCPTPMPFWQEIQTPPDWAVAGAPFDQKGVRYPWGNTSQRLSVIMASYLPAAAIPGAVTIHARLAYGAGAESVHAGFRIGGVEYYGAWAVLGAAYADFTWTFAVNPATLAPWTAAQLNGCEIILGTSPGANNAYCDRLYLEVPFTLPAPPGPGGAPYTPGNQHDWLRQVRRNVGLTYATAAALTGGTVSATRWRQLEEYGRHAVTPAEIVGIAAAFGVPVAFVQERLARS